MPAVMEAVQNMSTEEKFLVIDMLWRDIAASNEEYAPQWHFDVLREREQSLADGTAKLTGATSRRNSSLGGLSPYDCKAP